MFTPRGERLDAPRVGAGRPATARIPGPEADLRAELIAGRLIGLGATLSLHREGTGSLATPEHLADLYAPALLPLPAGRRSHPQDVDPQAGELLDDVLGRVPVRHQH